jgi:glycosyltransferase involved in cell wall biosynthesis
VQDRPLVSVIMPVYNGERFLQEAIDSIVRQSFDQMEFVIVNDGSTDNSQNIINTNRKRYPWIKVVHLDRNRGVSTAINEGLKHIEAEFVCLAAADDIQYPNRLHDSYQAIVEQERDVLLFEFDMIDEEGQSLNRSNRIPDFLNQENILLEELKRNYFFSGACLFRYDPSINFDASLRNSEDYDWFLKMLLAQKRIEFLKRSLLQVRVHKGSLSSNHKESQLTSRNVLEKYKFDELYCTLEAQGHAEEDILLTFVIMSVVKDDPDVGLFYCSQMKPNNKRTLFEKSFYEGVLQTKKENWDQAHSCLLIASDMDSKNAAVYNNLAVADYMVNTNTKNANQYFISALKYQPHYYDALHNQRQLNENDGSKGKLIITQRLLRDTIIHTNEKLIK